MYSSCLVDWFGGSFFREAQDRYLVLEEGGGGCEEAWAGS